jgi:hypothetical protein
MRFRPSSIFYAAGKAAYAQRCLEGAGFPLTVAASRWMVALAYGYPSWEALQCDVVQGDPSGLDEEMDAIITAERFSLSLDAIAVTTGLPLPLCCSLANEVLFTGRPQRVSSTLPNEGSPWMTPDEFARERTRPRMMLPW